MTMQQYCLRWNNHQPNFISVFSSLLNSESLVDVTLAAEGRHLQAHKVVLSACSSYFQSLFTINPCQHPIVILKDVKFTDLKVMVDFMYYGEVNVSQEQLPHILKTAEMLKIKGLAEIPVDQSVARSHNSSVDRAELLTPGDTSWNLEGTRHLSPSPCPMSPSTKRKRLRKSSTGSGSGSTERTSEDQSSEVTLTAATGLLGTVIKTDQTSYSSEGNTTPHKLKQHSSDSELHRGSSHESVDSDSPHQITLQVPQQQELSMPQQSLESQSSIDVQGPPPSSSQQAVTEKTISTTHAQLSQQYLQKSQQLVMGPKRHRFLMRQQRIKRESDSGHITETETSTQYLSLPPVKIERQCSDPLPTHSPPPGHLLTVPGAILTKQHSHPLLPSQTHPPISPPLHIQLISHHHTTESAERAISPVVVVTETPASSLAEFPPRGDSASTATLRVRTDELKRSASSPSSSGRSSHCPVVRSGPALGCNYCWNTVDTHGRILRRKTKYHCPECQTNLCIVPCFQEYHERHMSSGQTDPIALTSSVMKVFPKTTSM